MPNKPIKRLQYPHTLPWTRLLRLLQLEQHIVDRSGQVYRVQQKLLSNTPGAVPKVVLTPEASDQC
jgi:hypothetical protein